MIERKIKKLPVDDDREKIIVTLYNGNCAQGSYEAKVLQFELLKALSDNPQLGYCGSAMFQKLRMEHTGEHWTMELEAVVAI